MQQVELPAGGVPGEQPDGTQAIEERRWMVHRVGSQVGALDGGKVEIAP